MKGVKCLEHHSAIKHLGSIGERITLFLVLTHFPIDFLAI